MKVETKYIGEVEISEDSILEFSKGLPAFEGDKQFVLVPFEEENPFFILQSIETKDTAFFVVDPFTFFNDYNVKLSDSTIEQLEVEKEGEVAIFVLLTLQEPFSKTTANLQAPIVINMKKNKGKQFVMSDSSYGTKHYIMPQVVASPQEIT